MNRLTNSRKNSKKRGKHSKSKALKISFITLFQIISLIIIIVCIFHIFQWYKNNKKTNEVMETILNTATIKDEEINIDENTTTTTLSVDINSIKELNSDIIGWISIPNTNINYPVVQTTDNSFYLTHSLDKTYNKAGWIFADYKNSNLKNSILDKNTVIYGHNRENNSMFGSLKNVLKKDWQKNPDNKYINFSTNQTPMLWEIFSVYTIDDESYYITTEFYSDNEFEKFINTIKKRSIYDFKVDLNINDNILTLSTCTNIGNGRAVVHAKLVK